MGDSKSLSRQQADIMKLVLIFAIAAIGDGL